MTEEYKDKLESKILEKIKAAQERFYKILNEVKSLKFTLQPLPEAGKPKRVAALDGGGYSEDFIGVTVIPARAAGAIFEQGKEPIWIEENDVEILTLEEDPKNYSSLFRDFLELQVAFKLAQKKPDVLFLDGSVSSFAYKGIPRSIRFTQQDTTSQGKSTADVNQSMDSKFHELFFKYLRTAYEFIKFCILNDVLLVGVSKDSRADILVTQIYKALNKKKPPINDTSLVNILAKGTTGFTKPIVYTPKPRPFRSNVWKEAEVFQEKELQSFSLSYFILKEGAQPIRVDSLLPQKNQLEKVQETIVTYHDGNGFIIPAYLTHGRAHMRQDLGNRIINFLVEKVLEESPEAYKSFLAPRRRDTIQ